MEQHVSVDGGAGRFVRTQSLPVGGQLDKPEVAQTRPFKSEAASCIRPLTVAVSLACRVDIVLAYQRYNDYRHRSKYCGCFANYHRRGRCDGRFRKFLRSLKPVCRDRSCKRDPLLQHYLV